MTSDRWQQIRPLFDQIAASPPAAREAALAASGLDAQALADLRSLLRHHDDATAAFLLAPAVPDTLAPQPPARTGQRLGAWQIVRAIGSGGMGEVFEARRADGRYEGRAAVKLLKRGMDSTSVLQRFALERQALARLNHPHIARLLDAGASDEGLPYFVLDFIDGRPIDEAVRGLPLQARLDLFLQLAEAVAHAHRNLLVHRDLKPGNVLVDRDGQVKLLDFGIAKALDPIEGHDGGTTVGGVRPFTPNYASPEQLRGEPVTTATDIYSLGVLLYQMLTGTRPTGRHATTAAEAARSALEDEPTRPSRLSPSEAVDPQWLQTRRRLEGDLDNILLKALEKRVERRYSSVEAMTTDLRAFRDGRPVSAHAASPTYVLTKFVRRHRWAVLAASLGALGLATGMAAALMAERAAVAVGAAALAAGLGVALMQARQAAAARDLAQARFEDLRQLAHAVLFDYHDLIEPLQGATPVRKRLVEDALLYLKKMVQAAPTDRPARREMGMAYRVIGFVQRNGFRRPHLGDTEGAMRSYAQAIALLETLVAEDASDQESAYELALALSARAGVLGQDHDLDQARPLLERAAALFTTHMRRDTPDHKHRLELARTHLRLASALIDNNDTPGTLQALALARQTLDSLVALAPEHAELPHVWVWVHGVAARVCQSTNDWAGVAREKTLSFEITLQLSEREPDNARFLEDLGGNAHQLLSCAGMQGNAAAVRRWGLEACERLGTVVRRDPDDRVARASYVDCLIASAGELTRVGEPVQALDRLDAVQPILTHAMQRWRDQPEIRLRETLLACTWATAHHRAGQYELAEQSLRQADEVLAALQTDFAGHAVLDGAALGTAYTHAWIQAERVLLHGDEAERGAALAAMRAVVTQRELLKARKAATLVVFARALEEAPQWLERLKGRGQA
jgi:eukaryotic-like serine/threonine-protein kinase